MKLEMSDLNQAPRCGSQTDAFVTADAAGKLRHKSGHVSSNSNCSFVAFVRESPKWTQNLRALVELGNSRFSTRLRYGT